MVDKELRDTIQITTLRAGEMSIEQIVALKALEARKLARLEAEIARSTEALKELMTPEAFQAYQDAMAKRLQEQDDELKREADHIRQWTQKPPDKM